MRSLTILLPPTYSIGDFEWEVQQLNSGVFTIESVELPQPCPKRGIRRRDPSMIHRKGLKNGWHVSGTFVKSVAVNQQESPR